MNITNISKMLLDNMPYIKPFRFIDEVLEVDEHHILGHYTYREDEFFYSGHFPDNPVTPGVIMIETMAQIGLVAFGIYLLQNENTDVDISKVKFTFTNSNINFHKIVEPGEKVIVRSEKELFRFQKLKCKVRMETLDQKRICSGFLAGMIIQ